MTRPSPKPMTSTSPSPFESTKPSPTPLPTLGLLLGQRLRRDRVQLAVWILGTGLLVAASVSAVSTSYGSPADRESILKIAVSTPALLMLRGLPDGTSVGGFAFFQLFAFLGVLAGLMSTFLAVRHTRADEETGRAELVESTPASRMLPLVATLVHGVLANLALGVVVALAYTTVPGDPGQPPLVGALLTGAALAGVGIVSLAAALVVAQAVQSARGANALSAAVVGAFYLLAGAGNALGAVSSDGASVTSAWPSWLTPIGWGHQTHPYTAPTIAPLLLSLAAFAVLSAAAVALQARRDLGASLVGQRCGRSRASRTLSTAGALAWRLQWPSVVGWAVGGAALGAILGGLAPTLIAAVSTDTSVTSALQALAPGENRSVTQLFTLAIFEFAGVLAAGAAIQAIIRLRQEQAGGTAELVLASAVSRGRWMLGYLAVGAAAIVAVLAAATLAALATGGGSSALAPGDVVAAAVSQLPVSLLYLGAVALVFTVVPRATIAIGWGALAAGAGIGLYGGLIGLPEWLRSLSPFAHTPGQSGPPGDFSGGFWMLGIAVVAAALALVVIRRREVTL